MLRLMRTSQTYTRYQTPNEFLTQLQRQPDVHTILLHDRKRTKITNIPRPGYDYWLTQPLDASERYGFSCMLRRIICTPDNSLFGVMGVAAASNERSQVTNIISRSGIGTNRHVKAVTALRPNEQSVHTDPTGSLWGVSIALNETSSA